MKSFQFILFAGLVALATSATAGPGRPNGSAQKPVAKDCEMYFVKTTVTQGNREVSTCKAVIAKPMCQREAKAAGGECVVVPVTCSGSAFGHDVSC